MPTKKHSVKVTLTGTEHLTMLGNEINIHDIKSIVVDGRGLIREVYLKDTLPTTPATPTDEKVTGDF